MQTTDVKMLWSELNSSTSEAQIPGKDSFTPFAAWVGTTGGASCVRTQQASNRKGAEAVLTVICARVSKARTESIQSDQSIQFI